MIRVRIEYIRRALNGVANCLRDGLEIRGYTYWSAFDNFEWSLGYRPTFGLIAVNRETQERTVKPSARYLGSMPAPMRCKESSQGDIMSEDTKHDYRWWQKGVVYQIYPRVTRTATAMGWATCPGSLNAWIT